MKTTSKQSKLMKPNSRGCKRNPTLDQIKGDTAVAYTDWLPHNRSQFTKVLTLVGYNSYRVRLPGNLGTVTKSGDGYLAERATGAVQDFVKSAHARMWLAEPYPHRRPNPSIGSKVKELYKDAVHAVTKKKKSAAALKRLKDAEHRASNPRGRRVRKNPEAEAADLFERFHGVPSKEILEYRTKFHVHEDLAGLGQLTELVFFTPGAKIEQVTIEEEDLGSSAWLCASEDGKQLYILGDVVLDLEPLGYREDVDVKDAVELGRLTNVVYRTQKEFHQLKMMDYDHRLGKREKWQKTDGVGPDMNRAVAECPVLAYYPVENKLAVIGGQYLILPEGISN